jgi:hypothetical protein
MHAMLILGMYLANLARDPAIAMPVQPNSSAVLTIFMLIGVFGLTYLRTKCPQGKLYLRTSSLSSLIVLNFFYYCQLILQQFLLVLLVL